MSSQLFKIQSRTINELACEFHGQLPSLKYVNVNRPMVMLFASAFDTRVGGKERSEDNIEKLRMKILTLSESPTQKK
jgi:hypothetical protein